MEVDHASMRRSDVDTSSDSQRRHPAAQVGFGTYPLEGDEAVTAIVSALDVGYRLLDTAVNYGNEGDVGEALKRSDVARTEIRVSPASFRGATTRTKRRSPVPASRWNGSDSTISTCT